VLSIDRGGSVCAFQALGRTSLPKHEEIDTWMADARSIDR
jgi:hypothetical protein